jgi:hypothetical protein
MAFPSKGLTVNNPLDEYTSLTKAQAVGKIETPLNAARVRLSPRRPADSVPEWRNWQTR